MSAGKPDAMPSKSSPFVLSSTRSGSSRQVTSNDPQAPFHSHVISGG